MLSDVSKDRLLTRLAAEGFSEVCVVSGDVICGILKFNFTWGLMVGLSSCGYERRYCFEDATDAAAALKQWDGDGHPAGPWIKCKGAGIDLFNPNYSEAMFEH